MRKKPFHPCIYAYANIEHTLTLRIDNHRIYQYCREFGAIPVLINKLNYPDMKVQLAVLGALRNLSYGRLNDDSKVCNLCVCVCMCICIVLACVRYVS